MLGNNRGTAIEMNEKRGGLGGRVVSKLRVVTVAAALGVAALVPLQCCAADAFALGIITQVAVNGGADTANPGLSCIHLDVAVDASCTAGYVAILNNNSKLINAAISAKATNRPVTIYYTTGFTTDLHCPGLVFTRCAVNSIILR